jgi:hypothetical protein
LKKATGDINGSTLKCELFFLLCYIYSPFAMKNYFQNHIRLLLIIALISFITGLITYLVNGNELAIVFMPLGALMLTTHILYLKEYRKNSNNPKLKFPY